MRVLAQTSTSNQDAGYSPRCCRFRTTDAIPHSTLPRSSAASEPCKRWFLIWIECWSGDLVPMCFLHVVGYGLVNAAGSTPASPSGWRPRRTAPAEDQGEIRAVAGHALEEVFAQGRLARDRSSRRWRHWEVVKASQPAITEISKAYRMIKTIRSFRISR